MREGAKVKRKGDKRAADRRGEVYEEVGRFHSGFRPWEEEN